MMQIQQRFGILLSSVRSTLNRFYYPPRLAVIIRTFEYSYPFDLISAMVVRNDHRARSFNRLDVLSDGVGPETPLLAYILVPKYPIDQRWRRRIKDLYLARVLHWNNRSRGMQSI